MPRTQSTEYEKGAIVLPKDMHQGTVDVRNAEADFGMKKNTFYSGLNGGLFWFLFTHCTVGTPQYLYACLSGIVLSVLWFAVAWRTKDLMTLWNNGVANLEIMDKDITGGRIFASQEFKVLDRKRMTHHVVLLALIFIIGGGWTALAINSNLESKALLKNNNGGYSYGYK